ncbi:MAG: ABC transporter permease [Anaerolineae bacterium]|nr:ABC transporter permease [Anaerolineae bacterium]
MSKNIPAPASSQRGGSLLRRLSGNRSGAFGLLLVLAFLLVALAGLLGLTPRLPAEQFMSHRLAPPTADFPLGTDLFGRDIASRLISGAAVSLRVAVTAVALAGGLGAALGILAGFAGGRVDNLLMRLMDILFAFPALLLALVIVTVLGPGPANSALAIAIVYLPIFARVARGPVLSVKELDFVLAARCLGLRPFSVLLSHILPNIVAPLIVQVSLALSWALLTEAALSYLGLGTRPPAASWGVMLSESRALAERAPWMMVFPGLAIMAGVLGFNLLGDGLRDVLDPRLRGPGKGVRA